MDRKKQDKTQEMPVISPLAKDKTYGEKKYDLIFDKVLNYWTNLLASAGFSQWAEHSVKPIKMFGDKSPREIQQGLANWISKGYFMNKLKENITLTEGEGAAARVVAERSMARARSLTLLAPGFIVMIPSVWLGAKLKPAIVEWFNKRHYGAEAMDDPTLQARHQAIAAEARPTLLGTVVARLGTVLAVQAAAQTIGSDKNLLNQLGEKTNINVLKNFKGIDPVTNTIGSTVAGALPLEVQQRYDRFAQRKGLSWSREQLINGAKELGLQIEHIEHDAEAANAFLKQHAEQITKHLSSGVNKTRAAAGHKIEKESDGLYNRATQDLGRFIAADTIYTLVSAGTIRPFLKLLKNVPGMSYKPKVAANSATFEGDHIKVPSNPFADKAQEPAARDAVPASNDSLYAATTERENTAAANEAQFSSNQPSLQVSNVREHGKLAAEPEQKIA